MHPLLNIAVMAARNAAKIIMRFVNHIDAVSVNEKSRNDFVTEVDRLSEEEIIHTIRKSYPNHGLLAEESGYQEGDDYCWIIDPLDGTTNFMHGFPQFAISIGLMHKDTLEVGVVYDPMRQELFTAARGRGANMNDRRMRVSQTKKLAGALLGTGFPFRETHHFKPYMKTFETIFPQVSGIRRAGAAALDLAYVAAGRLDGFWEPTLKEWDIAAGALLIQEAGGVITDFHGQDQYLDNGTVIAGNMKVHKILLEEVHKSLHQ